MCSHWTIRQAGMNTLTPIHLPSDFDFASLLQQAFENQRDDLAVNISMPSALLANEISSKTSISDSVGEYTRDSVGESSIPEQEQRRSHAKTQSKKNRQLKRAAAKALKTPETYVAPSPKRPRLQESVILDVGMDQLRASHNGFTGYHTEYGNEEYTLNDMIGEGSKFNFRKIEWNGKFDMTLVKTVIKLLIALADNQRGGFGALSAGVSCDQGMKHPQVVGQSIATNDHIIRNLLSDPDVRRLAGYQSSAFYHCQPVLYKQYADNRTELKKKDASLYWNFANSIFAHVTFNFGPRTVCVEHTDFANHADGFCAITALSPTERGYDYKKGGHLILWDLKLVIEFPPGTTILLLSAVLRHSNTAIAPDKWRYSFTQYTAGSLFRWVERGFQMEKDFWASLSSEEAKLAKARDKERWKSAFANFTKFVV
ncbi:hypothetical protein VNI00_009585 [Paramarasmius palmivorus]|uniref:Uncharacterized protein n=1 Tax=Paramarasmius palmivorus TaxID=297713 RepID=A0AAW0CP01_9AGAR